MDIRYLVRVVPFPTRRVHHFSCGRGACSVRHFSCHICACELAWRVCEEVWGGRGGALRSAGPGVQDMYTEVPIPAALQEYRSFEFLRRDLRVSQPASRNGGSMHGGGDGGSLHGAALAQPSGSSSSGSGASSPRLSHVAASQCCHVCSHLLPNSSLCIPLLAFP